MRPLIESKLGCATRLLSPLLDLIERTLKEYLTEAEDVEEPEAEGAAALLVDTAGTSAGWVYHSIDLRYEATQRGLWDLSIQVIGKMILAGIPLCGPSRPLRLCVKTAASPGRGNGILTA